MTDRGDSKTMLGVTNTAEVVATAEEFIVSDAEPEGNYGFANRISQHPDFAGHC